VVTADRNLISRTYPADTVVLAVGMQARKNKVEELRGIVPATEVSIIGDCYKPRNIYYATNEGFNSVIEL